MFKAYLSCVLPEEYFDMVFLDTLVNEYADFRFANTNSKRILRILGIGIYVHMSFCARTHSVHSYKLPDIIQHMNRVLILKLDGDYPIHALRELFVKLELPIFAKKA